MGLRLDLHALLVSKLGSSNVYYQPPESVKMNYPCIVYTYSSNDTRFADDRPYSIVRKYQVTVIDPNPDSSIPDKIATLSKCSLDRVFTASKLNHYVFTLYY